MLMSSAIGEASRRITGVLAGRSLAAIFRCLADMRSIAAPHPNPLPIRWGEGENIFVRRYPGWRSVLADGHQSLPRAIIVLPFQGANFFATPERDQREPET